MARTHSLPAASSLPSGGDRLSPVISPYIAPLKAARSCASSSPGRMFRNLESRNHARVCHRRLRVVKASLPGGSGGVPRARGSPPHPLADVCAVRLFRGRRKNFSPPGTAAEARRAAFISKLSEFYSWRIEAQGGEKGKSARRRSFHAFLTLRRNQSFFCSSSCCFFSSSSRRARRSTLPTMDLGSSSRNSKMRGTL